MSLFGPTFIRENKRISIKLNLSLSNHPCVKGYKSDRASALTVSGSYMEILCVNLETLRLVQASFLPLPYPTLPYPTSIPGRDTTLDKCLLGVAALNQEEKESILIS